MTTPRKQLYESLVVGDSPIESIVKQLDLVSKDLIRHVSYYTNTPPSSKPTLSYQPGESEFVARLSSELSLSKEVCFTLLRSFFSSEIAHSLSSTDAPHEHAYDEELVASIDRFKTSERKHTLAIWEQIFKYASVDEVYSPGIVEWLSLTFPDPSSRSSFIVSFLPLLNTEDEVAAVKVMFHILFKSWPVPTDETFALLKDALITRNASSLRVIVVLAAMQIDAYITNPPAKVETACHPAIDLVSTCVQVMRDETGDLQVNPATIHKGIAFLTNATFPDDMTSYAKEVFTPILSLLTRTFTDTAPFFPLIKSIYKASPHLAEQFWMKSDVNLVSLLDVWKERFPVCFEVIEGLACVLSHQTVMKVYEYFSALSGVCAHFDGGVESDGSGGYIWNGRKFISNSELDIHPQRGARVCVVGSDNAFGNAMSGVGEIVTVECACSGWTLTLSLLQSFVASRETKTSYIGMRECQTILELYAGMFESFGDNKLRFFEYLTGFEQVLRGAVKRGVDMEDARVVSAGIRCLDQLGLIYSFEVTEIDRLVRYEQRVGTYPFLISFLNYLNTANALPYLAYIKELFKMYDGWKYEDVCQKFIIGTCILQICSDTGFPLKIDVSSYFIRINSLMDVTATTPLIEQFVYEALLHGSGGIFTQSPKLELADLALSSATLEDLPAVLKLAKFFPNKVAKCLRRFCEQGWAFQACLDFALANAKHSLGVMECLASHGFIGRLDVAAVWDVLGDVKAPESIEEIEISTRKCVLFACFLFTGRGSEHVEKYVQLYKGIKLPTTELAELSNALSEVGIDLSAFKRDVFEEYGVDYAYNIGHLESALRDYKDIERDAIIRMTERVNTSLSLIDATLTHIQKWRVVVELSLSLGKAKINCYPIVTDLLEKILAQALNEQMSVSYISELTAAMQFLLTYSKPLTRVQITATLESLEQVYAMDVMLDACNPSLRQSVSICMHVSLSHLSELAAPELQKIDTAVLERQLTVQTEFWIRVAHENIATRSFEAYRTLHTISLQSLAITFKLLHTLQKASSTWIRAICDTGLFEVCVEVFGYLMARSSELDVVLDVLQFIQSVSGSIDLASKILSTGLMSGFSSTAQSLMPHKTSSPIVMGIFIEQLEIINVLLETLPEHSTHNQTLLALIGGVYEHHIRHFLYIKDTYSTGELRVMDCLTRVFYHLAKVRMDGQDRDVNGNARLCNVSWLCCVGYEKNVCEVLKFVCGLMTHPNQLVRTIRPTKAISIDANDIVVNGTDEKITDAELRHVKKILATILVNCCHCLRWSTGCEDALVGNDVIYRSIFSTDAQDSSNNRDAAFHISNLMDVFGIFKSICNQPPNTAAEVERAYVNTGVESILVLILQEFLRGDRGARGCLEDIIGSKVCDSKYIAFVSKQI